MTHPIFSPYTHLIHSPQYKTNQERTVSLADYKNWPGLISIWLNLSIYILLLFVFYTLCCETLMFLFLILLQLMLLFFEHHVLSHIRSGGEDLVAERISNHYLERELFLPLEFRIYIFRPMRMTDAILPGSSHWATQKATLTILAVSSLPHLLATGQTIIFPSHHRESAKHYEESTSYLWTIGVWVIILSSFIFPSKPTDPRRKKLDIFNTCFDFSILIPVLTTASQLLLWLEGLYSFSTLQLFPYPVTYRTKVFFCLELLIKLSNWKLSISPSTHLFFLLI